MLIFSVLICVVSLTLQLPVLLNIHNRCQDINLTSLVYFMDGGWWNVLPDQGIDANAIMRNRIKPDSGQNVLEGALVYKIQKRQNTESDELIQDESKHIQLLVVWHVDHIKGLRVRALLIEHDKKLDEDKLRWLYQKYWHSLNAWIDPIESNWMLDDATMLATTIKTMNGGYRWDIFISEGMEDNFEKPLWIDAER
jgi:hypothetical protein